MRYKQSCPYCGSESYLAGLWISRVAKVTPFVVFLAVLLSL